MADCNRAETYLRVSNCGTFIETSRGARVNKENALRLHSLLLKGKGIGEKLDDFTVTGETIDYIKIGCHTIYWAEINRFLESNDLARV